MNPIKYIINIFKTKTYLFTSTDGSWIVSKPFLRNPTAEYKKCYDTIRGYSCDLMYIDEVCEDYEK